MMKNSASGSDGWIVNKTTRVIRWRGPNGEEEEEEEEGGKKE